MKCLMSQCVNISHGSKCCDLILFYFCKVKDVNDLSSDVSEKIFQQFQAGIL